MTSNNIAILVLFMPSQKDF